MNGSPRAAGSPFLKALGSPLLTCPGAERLRKKDLALLVYLRLERRRAHSRSMLANLLWGDSTEEKARHSLTQALGRIRSVLGAECLDADHDRVEWRGELPCDAALLQEMTGAPPDPALGLYTGDFLAQFAPGRGAREFEDWMDGRRAHYRTLALELLDRAGDEAEAAGDWGAALRIGERSADVDPFWERGQRRVMRALHELGERNRALRHYEKFAALLARELEEDPDPETQALAERLRNAPRLPPATIHTAEPAPSAEVIGQPVAADPPAAEASPRPIPAEEAPSAPNLRAGRRSRLLFTSSALAVLALSIVFLTRKGAPSPVIESGAPPVAGLDLPAPGSPIAALSDWVRTDGRWIYYRYETYMPGACARRTEAAGNWGREGWTSGLAARCIDGAWLAVDLQPLIRRSDVAPQTTYCLNFLYIEDETSFWGQHGAEAAPGLDSIRVVAPNGSYNIGFAAVRDARGAHRIVLTNRYPGPRC
jgi:DNA-binding SARP family transcriptional activator